MKPTFIEQQLAYRIHPHKFLLILHLLRLIYFDFIFDSSLPKKQEKVESQEEHISKDIVMESFYFYSIGAS